jgi:hypothetical protein
MYSNNYGPSALATINKDSKLITLPSLYEINLLQKFVSILHLALIKSMVNFNVVIAFATTKAITQPNQEPYGQLNP